MFTPSSSDGSATVSSRRKSFQQHQYAHRADQYGHWPSCQCWCMSHIDNGLAVLSQTGECLKDLVSSTRVEIPSWLVGNDHRRIICKCTGNCNTLLLTTGKFTRQTGGEVIDVCQLQAEESAVTPRSSLESTPPPSSRARRTFSSAVSVGINWKN